LKAIVNTDCISFILHRLIISNEPSCHMDPTFVCLIQRFKYIFVLYLCMINCVWFLLAMWWIYLNFLLSLKFAMSGNNLHIWPRGEFMMTSLPNEDCTFTGNLFAPFYVFEKLKTREALLSFYTEHFPDLLRLIGKEKLVEQFFEKEPQTLISIKVNFNFIIFCGRSIC